jgi:beta-phosphoglucomutase-like phosphatase (HAD superfamily)
MNTSTLRLKAVIFDVYGVLLDFAAISGASSSHAMHAWDVRRDEEFALEAGARFVAPCGAMKRGGAAASCFAALPVRPRLLRELRS